MAPEAILAVIKFADGWRILPGGSNLEPYPSQEAAVSVARLLVKYAELSGREVQLLVHDTFGELYKAAPAKAAGSLSAELDHPRRDLDLGRPDQRHPRPARGRTETDERAVVQEPTTRFFPANVPGAGRVREIGGGPALLVMRSRSQRRWCVSRPEPEHLGDPPVNDR
ncbi:MAG: hypothetical protein M3M95_06170 [Pseudomonadota bacterium]|nr:hypothetical protein [Pseudomonadota bacterium]